MNEVAEAAAYTALARVQPAAGFSEIGHGREFAVNRTSGVPARVECVAGFLRVFFVLEAHVNVANKICWLLARRSIERAQVELTVIVVVAND